MAEPFELSAVEARRLIGARELSPVELLESCIGRIEVVNPAINAVVTTAFDRAREEARVAEAAVMRGDALGPPHGDGAVEGGRRPFRGGTRRSRWQLVFARDHIST